jgi:hypothetical protein
MRIDPANTAAVQSTVSHEFDDITVRHSGRVMHLLVVRERQEANPDRRIHEDDHAAENPLPAPCPSRVHAAGLT